MAENEKVMPEGVYGYQDLSLTTTDYWYGTYTLPAGLELIESRAFANTQTFIKDVYCLSIKAPECHVDAFSTGGYIANKRVCQNRHALIFLRKAPTFSSQGFVMS